MLGKIAALVSERDRAAKARDHELVAKLNAQLAKMGDAGRTTADRAAKRIPHMGAKR
jgi:hypothetical protein